LRIRYRSVCRWQYSCRAARSQLPLFSMKASSERSSSPPYSPSVLSIGSSNPSL
jgi:hypothetical protein